MKKKLKFLTNSQRGITLVALIVTIIILLILAGISISALTQKGLFSRAKQAEQKSKEAQEQENAYLGDYENELNKYISGKTDEIQADGSWNSSKKVNSPQLMDGMTGVYWDDKGQEVTVTADNQDNWYDYENQKWANAKTKDGSYWVWIPRYAYKIESGCYTNTAGTITVKFLQGKSNKDFNNTEIKTTYPTVSNGAMQDYVVHPSFTNGTSNHFMNGEWNDNVTGYWVAKYAAGYQASTTDASDATKVVNGNDTIVYSNKNYTTSNGYKSNALSQDLSTLPKMSYPVFKPLTYAYNCISTGDSYTLSKEISTAGDFYGLNSSKTDSHQMKNSEWGAVAYLTQSSCGRNGTEITMNSKNLSNLDSKYIYAVTGYSGENANGIDASTTGNMSGIFDLSGCVGERVSGYVTNGNDNLKFGTSFATTTETNADGYKTLSTEYATVYPYDDNNLGTTYFSKKSSTYGFGDAILETSGRTSTTDGWFLDYSTFTDSKIPFFVRGGSSGNNSSNTGVFAYSNAYGNATHLSGFRSILIAL